jgi:hypothetical protein
VVYIVGMAAKATKRRGPGRPEKRNAYVIQINVKLNRPIIKALAGNRTPNKKTVAAVIRGLIIADLLKHKNISENDLPE